MDRIGEVEAKPPQTLKAENRKAVVFQPTQGERRWEGINSL